MELLAPERACLEHYLPGLDKQLADRPLLELERPRSGALDLFREPDGPRLLVPREHGGLGATPVEAVRVQRAVGSRSPSLAVATAMHHFSVASLAELSALGDGMEWAVLQAIAEHRWLLSSGFAEGRPGQHILRPSMRAVRADGGLRVSGRKKPCSLTWSMDLLSASVMVSDPAGGPERLAVVLVPAASPGVSRHPFWQSWILAGAESDEVVLDDVLVPDQLVVYPDGVTGTDPAQARGFVWFELLISAAYVGAASALVERVVRAGRGTPAERAGLCLELEAVMAALEREAVALAGGRDDVGDPRADDDRLARTLCVRYSVEQALARVTADAAALAGGMAFIGSSELSYLMAASRPLAFHPPSRAGAMQALDAWFAGEPMTL